MAQVPLTRGKVVTIDDEDIALISSHRWYFDPGTRSHNGYAKGRLDGKTVYMHRLLAGATAADIVDHANRNSLDNRRSNLRLATRCESSRNATKPSNKNGYRGVEAKNDKFRAVITVNRRVIRGPSRTTASQAAVDYDALALKHHGSFAVLNFSLVEVSA